MFLNPEEAVLVVVDPVLKALRSNESQNVVVRS
jgi:hypothetical protein